MPNHPQDDRKLDNKIHSLQAGVDDRHGKIRPRKDPAPDSDAPLPPYSRISRRSNCSPTTACQGQVAPQADGRRPEVRASLPAGVARFTASQNQRIVAMSGGQCTYPDCNTFFAYLDDDNNLGWDFQGAHINSPTENGPGYDPDIDENYVNDPYLNGIALCLKHHKLVDDHPTTYTAGRLQEWKVQRFRAIRLSEDHLSSWYKLERAHIPVEGANGELEQVKLYYWSDRDGNVHLLDPIQAEEVDRMFVLSAQIGALGNVPPTTFGKDYHGDDNESALHNIILLMADVPHARFRDLLKYSLEGHLPDDWIAERREKMIEALDIPDEQLRQQALDIWNRATEEE